jgi:predicted nucleic acid-binding Zn ribbon protein
MALLNQPRQADGLSEEPQLGPFRAAASGNGVFLSIDAGRQRQARLTTFWPARLEARRRAICASAVSGIVQRRQVAFSQPGASACRPTASNKLRV